MEMLADMTFASNRMRQLENGKVPRSEKSSPPEGVGKEWSSQKEKGIAMDRLLIKQESRHAQDRSFLMRNVAFTTARTITSNAEQKKIQKEWKPKGGSGEFKKRRAGLVIQAAAEIVGILPGEATQTVSAASSSSNQPHGLRMAVGAKSAGRSMRSPLEQNDGKKTFTFPSFQTPQGANATGGNLNFNWGSDRVTGSKSGKVEKWKISKRGQRRERGMGKKDTTPRR